MKDLKVVVIGAGSYVFGPSILIQALVEHRLTSIDLALVDVDAEMVELMGAVGRRLATEHAVDARITTHTDRLAALDGADFVICSAARQIYPRFETDCGVIDRLMPGHLVTEFGGIAGISYSLRQIALIEEIANDMRRICPDAWLLNSANPLPRVSQAAHEAGIRTAGFCNVTIGTYGLLWRLLRGEQAEYPYAAAREAWQLTMGGVNHFAWVLGFSDRATNADLLPSFRAILDRRGSTGNPLCEALYRELGIFPVPCDNHIRDFVRPRGVLPQREAPTHGTPEERRRRTAYLRAVGAGDASWEELQRHPSWERPVDFVAALAFGKPVSFSALDLINEGQAPDLPASAFVETPCTIADGKIQPVRLALPKAVQPYAAHTARVTDTIVQAARQRSRRLVHAAVELDPTIIDKSAGFRAIDACLEAHADILPAYA